jgi:hypothetical protein
MIFVLEGEVFHVLQPRTRGAPETEDGEYEYAEEDAEADDAQDILPIFNKEAAKHGLTGRQW